MSVLLLIVSISNTKKHMKMATVIFILAYAQTKVMLDGKSTKYRQRLLPPMPMEAHQLVHQHPNNISQARALALILLAAGDQVLALAQAHQVLLQPEVEQAQVKVKQQLHIKKSKEVVFLAAPTKVN